MILAAWIYRLKATDAIKRIDDLVFYYGRDRLVRGRSFNTIVLARYFRRSRLILRVAENLDVPCRISPNIFFLVFSDGDLETHFNVALHCHGA